MVVLFNVSLYWKEDGWGESLRDAFCFRLLFGFLISESDYLQFQIQFWRRYAVFDFEINSINPIYVLTNFLRSTLT
jgi:hypothetical protein